MYVAVKPLGRLADWIPAFERALPDATVVPLRDADESCVEYVVAWDVSPGALRSLPELRAVMLLGAGYDHLAIDEFPDVPIVRLTDSAMADDIALYCLSWVIHFQRDFDVFADSQEVAAWASPRLHRFPRDVTVGVLGAGTIGAVVMETCRRHGFEVLGWSRSRHDRPMHDFIAASDVLIDILPASQETQHLIGGAELAALGNGVLVNVGRGETVDTEALLRALDGDLRAAVLDVFEDEPLDAASPLWSHRKVTITPHVAGRTDPATAAAVIAANIHRVESGLAPHPLVER